MCRISGLPYTVRSLKGSLSWPDCHQRRVLQPAWLWFQSRCALVLEITWGSLGLLAGPAALLKQVPNGYKIRFGQFIITTWIHALVSRLPFILKAVSFYLSNWCYWWRGTDLLPFTPFPTPPPSTRPFPSRLNSHKTSCLQLHTCRLKTFMHLCTLNST